MVDHLADLVGLDEKGFILAPGADPVSFCEAARSTLNWSQAVRRELNEKGQARVLGEVFAADQLVPHDLLLECLAPARAAYGIDPSWALAFFSNKQLPWYVGGSAFYEKADGALRTCLLVREPFRRKERWLVYDRGEILSHEACHLARAMLSEPRFEEPLAYGMSDSALRRAAGGAFSARWEAPVLLASAVILVVGAGLELAGLGPWVKLACAVPLLGTAGALIARTARTNATLKAARRYLEPAFGRNSPAVLFRCSDEEIASLAHAGRRGTPISEWLAPRQGSLRWQVIQSRFPAETS